MSRWVGTVLPKDWAVLIERARKMKLWSWNISLAWRVCLVAFLAGRILFSLWGALIWAMHLMPLYQGPLYFDITPILQGIQGALIGVWQRWDGIHYQRIATFGYEESGLSAFFPLYPMLSRMLSLITGLPPVITLIIAGNLAFIISLRLFYQIAAEKFSADLARETLFSLIIFPSAIFFYSIYPQAMLLMFVLLAYRLAYQGRWAWAGAAGLCAGLTHPTSLPLTLLLAWEASDALQHKKPRPRFAILIAPVMNLVGTAGFMLWRSLAGFPTYQQVQSNVGMRNLHAPWEGLAAIIKFIASFWVDGGSFISWMYVFTFLLTIGISIWGIRKLPVAMTLYQVGFLVLILCTSVENDPLLGILRYPLAMFPLFIGIAAIGQSKTWRLVKFTVFVTLSLACSAMFFLWKGGMS